MVEQKELSSVEPSSAKKKKQRNTQMETWAAVSDWTRILSLTESNQGKKGGTYTYPNVIKALTNSSSDVKWVKQCRKWKKPLYFIEDDIWQNCTHVYEFTVTSHKIICTVVRRYLTFDVYQCFVSSLFWLQGEKVTKVSSCEHTQKHCF